MSKEKQMIEEMANTVYDNRPHKDIWLEDAEDIAKVLYEAGYRKQSEGEWREDVIAFCNVCSSCRAMVDRSAIKCNSGKLHYCPNCGAKMKGGEE